MSTVFVWDQEVPTLATPASGDKVLVHDISAGLKKVVTIGQILGAGVNLTGGAQIGDATTDTVGFYGATRIDQGTFTATAITALAAATISAANTSSVFGFSSQTVANAYVVRVRQMQADLDTLMAKVNSTGLIAITGL